MFSRICDFRVLRNWVYFGAMLSVLGSHITQAKSLMEEIKLVAHDGAANDFFGYSAALSQDTAIFGSYKADGQRGEDVGAAYIYTRQKDKWQLQAKLVASDGAPGDTFGGMSTIEKDTAVVGVIRADDTLAGEDTGAAYIFHRSDNQWSEQAKLTANDAAQGDSFGWSVGIHGDTIVVGAPRDDDKGKDSGSVYVFEYLANVWKQTAKLTAADGSSGDVFGISVAISKDTVLVGADLNEEKGVNAGAAYVFTRHQGQWTQQAKLTANDGSEGDIFGVRVALDDDTALISARRDDVENIGQDAGSAYIFTREGSQWIQQAKLTAPDGKADDRFGRSIALSDGKALIGAMFEDSVNENAGAAYLFSQTDNGWKFENKLTASDGAEQDVFGWAVAIDGNTAVVSANRDDDKGENAGAAYVFSIPQ